MNITSLYAPVHIDGSSVVGEHCVLGYPNGGERGCGHGNAVDGGVGAGGDSGVERVEEGAGALAVAVADVEAGEVHEGFEGQGYARRAGPGDEGEATGYRPIPVIAT